MEQIPVGTKVWVEDRSWLRSNGPFFVAEDNGGDRVILQRIERVVRGPYDARFVADRRTLRLTPVPPLQRQQPMMVTMRREERIKKAIGGFLGLAAGMGFWVWYLSDLGAPSGPEEHFVLTLMLAVTGGSVIALWQAFRGK